MQGHHDHRAVFYDSADALFSEVASFLAPAFALAQPTLVVATRIHQRGILAALARRHVEVDTALASGDLAVVDARLVLSRTVKGGTLDLAAYRTLINPIVNRSCSRRPDAHLWAYGEVVDLLWRKNRPEDALLLEVLWNNLLSDCPCSMLCGYYSRLSGEQAQYLPAVMHQHTKTWVATGG